MKIKDVMTGGVDAIRTDASIQHAARLMRDRDYGILPVVDMDILVGTVTDRDIVVRGVASDGAHDDLRVGDVMSRDPVTCRDDQSVSEVAAEMRKRQLRRLPILSESGDLVGIVALADLATQKDSIRSAAAVLAGVSK